MTLAGILRGAAYMSWEALLGNFLLEFSILSPSLEFLIMPLPSLTARAEDQRAGPSAAAWGGWGAHSGLHLPLPPRSSL